MKLPYVPLRKFIYNSRVFVSSIEDVVQESLIPSGYRLAYVSYNHGTSRSIVKNSVYGMSTDWLSYPNELPQDWLMKCVIVNLQTSLRESIYLVIRPISPTELLLGTGDDKR